MDPMVFGLRSIEASRESSPSPSPPSFVVERPVVGRAPMGDGRAPMGDGRSPIMGDADVCLARVMMGDVDDVDNNRPHSALSNLSLCNETTKLNSQQRQ